MTYGDLHFGHLSSNGSSLKPHSPQIAIILTSLNDGVNCDVFSIDFLISTAFASLSMFSVTNNPPFRDFESLLDSGMGSLLRVKSVFDSLNHYKFCLCFKSINLKL